MSNFTKFLIKTVYVDEDSENICSCKDDFYKTCPIRAANNLECFQSVIALTRIEDRDESLTADGIRAIDKKFNGLLDPLKDFHRD